MKFQSPVLGEGWHLQRSSSVIDLEPSCYLRWCSIWLFVLLLHGLGGVSPRRWRAWVVNEY